MVVHGRGPFLSMGAAPMNLTQHGCQVCRCQGTPGHDWKCLPVASFGKPEVPSKASGRPSEVQGDHAWSSHASDLLLDASERIFQLWCCLPPPQFNYLWNSVSVVVGGPGNRSLWILCVHCIVLWLSSGSGEIVASWQNTAYDQQPNPTKLMRNYAAAPA